jgi:hypothetical protein
MSQVKHYFNAKNQLAGELHDDVYKSIRRYKRHRLKILDAWGIDAKIVGDLEEDGCKEIRIFDQDYNKIYTVSFLTFKIYAIVRNYAGSQFFLPIKYWTVHEKLPSTRTSGGESEVSK